MEADQILPIGSIIRLIDGEKKLMIIGILQMEANRPDRKYDYIGVPYPEGYIDENTQFLFNHADIAEIFFHGYENDERSTLMQQIATELEKPEKQETDAPKRRLFGKKKQVR